jgi:hypothetical protein
MFWLIFELVAFLTPVKSLPFEPPKPVMEIRSVLNCNHERKELYLNYSYLSIVTAVH